MMPVLDETNVVTLGEGFTPIIKAQTLGCRLGCADLFIKDEGINPTASFKARGLSVAVSKAKELGIKRLTMPSAGNAGGAMTAYAARAGIEAHVFMPRDAPLSNQKEVGITGGKLSLVDGFINDAGRASQQSASGMGLFDISTLREPYRIEGKKTMGYEIAEQMNWTLPDAIIYPTGGGTGLAGMWKAFQELEQLQWIGSKRPRMFVVQAEGCAPIVSAFQSGLLFSEPWKDASTIASGIRVPSAIGDYLVLEAVRDSGGSAVAVSDEQIMEYLETIATLEGLFVCPEGAATAAALERLLANGSILGNETVLLLNTGSGLKYLDLF